MPYTGSDEDEPRNFFQKHQCINDADDDDCTMREMIDINIMQEPMFAPGWKIRKYYHFAVAGMFANGFTVDINRLMGVLIHRHGMLSIVGDDDDDNDEGDRRMVSAISHSAYA